jgi:hypothetical protein
LAIPDNDQFENFLRSISLHLERPDGDAIRLDAGAPGFLEAPEFYLKYSESELKLASCLKQVARELRAAGCASDDRIALAALGVIAETRPNEARAVQHANRCLALTCDAELDQAVVFPNKPLRGYVLSLGCVSLRAFDPQRFSYWSQRGGSGYPINLQSLHGCVALERERLATRLIDWSRVPGAETTVRKWGPALSAASLLDPYYQSVFWHHYGELSELLQKRLLVLESGGLINLNADSLLRGGYFKTQIGLFTWTVPDGRRSWAVMSTGNVLHMNLLPSEVLEKCEEWLDRELRFAGFGSINPIDRAAESYCRFLQRAHHHRLAERADEAFLHFVIGLDLLLGLEGRSTNSVAQRAAVLLHREPGLPLEERTTPLKRLYDSRSKYVHAGQSVTQKELDEVEKVCTEVLWALLAVCAAGELHSVEEWLNKIDYVFAALKAAKPVRDADFEGIGLPIPGRTRVAPNRVVANSASI